MCQLCSDPIPAAAADAIRGSVEDQYRYYGVDRKLVDWHRRDSRRLRDVRKVLLKGCCEEAETKEKESRTIRRQLNEAKKYLE